nr:tRNA lysidine(34) synthetase TilS [Roseibium sp. RKSG952]
MFRPLRDFESLAFAVSGGADSTALLVLFDEWACRNGWAGQFEAFTVDHGLRPESALEAGAVGELCAIRGIHHEVLHWRGDKPQSNLQAAARAARYRLLADAMKRRRLHALVLGHHLDDQIETFLDRLTRGSGVYGLGGMAPENKLGPEGLHLLRPMLEVGKARLAASLEARSVPWSEDRSNRDKAYKRVRLRNLARQLAEEGLEPQRLAQTAERMRRASSALQAWVQKVWSDHVEVHPSGPVRLSYPIWADLPLEIRLKLLAEMILRVTASPTPSRLQKLEGLEASLQSSGHTKSSLAGAFVQRRDGTLFAWKEAGRHPPSVMLLEDAKGGVWDNRFCIEADSGVPETLGDPLYIGPFSLAPARAGVQLPSGWPSEAFDCAPALWSKDAVLFVPEIYLAPVLHHKPHILFKRCYE